MNTVIDPILSARPGARKELADSTRKALNAVRLTPKYKLALRLWAAGVNKDEICNSLGLTINRLDFVKWSPIGKAYLQAITAEYEDQFKLLFGKVVGYIDKGLSSPSLDSNDKAARLWAGMSGRLMHTVRIERTAEDNVKDLLEGKAIDITPYEQNKIQSSQSEEVGE